MSFHNNTSPGELIERIDGDVAELSNFFSQLVIRIIGNLLLMAAMGLIWIGSFYLYGIGAARMGKWGGIIGWPVFIALSIIVGNLWGIWRGEWASAPGAARRMLNWGLAVLLVAIAIFGVSSALS